MSARPELVLGPHLALTVAPTAGIRVFERCPPVHSIVLHRGLVTAIPANVAHRVVLDAPYAGVAYLDARSYRFEDARRLAEAWQGFVPGVDCLQEAAGEAEKLGKRRLDPRVTRALERLEADDGTVRECAVHVGLSESRLTHRMVEELGAPPRRWRTWLRLQRAIGAALGGASLTHAAHAAGFTDSAHLTRTCKQLTGVLPSQMLTRTHVVRVTKTV